MQYRAALCKLEETSTISQQVNVANEPMECDTQNESRIIVTVSRDAYASTNKNI